MGAKRLVLASAVLVGACDSAYVETFETASGAVRDEAERYIVVLNRGSADDPEVLASRHGVVPHRVYRHAPAAGGFAAHLSAASVESLRRNPAVAWIEPDKRMYAYAQTVPTGINRIDAELNQVSAIDGTDTTLDVDIAIIDTGISSGHPDLNVAGGVNFATGSSWDDGDGHGTHCAGIAAARDNDIGVVGVAPGARLWAVRVLNNHGSGWNSDVIAGVNWVAQNAATIEVANMSLGGTGTDTGSCDGDALHRAICDAVAAGVTIVVAAGNETANAAGSTPAAYDEVITVSALSDFNGQPGGGAAATCRSDVDDSFASYSNYGPDVDIMAPGTCILSTYKLTGGPCNTYCTLSGTSMASPHVAGAAAVYKYLHPTATPAQVRQALINRARHSGCGAAPGGPCSDDPDTVDEPLLSMWHLDDGFERYAVGASLAQYEEKPAGVPGAITVSSTAQAGTRSAGLSLTPDGIAPVDFLAGKFCLPTASQDRFKANLKLRLDSFVAWNALVVTGTTDPTLYWWWIGPSGTVWDDTIVGTMSAGVWHDVEISINRTAGSATIALDGAAHVTALSPAWPSSSDPMLCLKVTSGVDVGQALYADEVLISIGD